MLGYLGILTLLEGLYCKCVRMMRIACPCIRPMTWKQRLRCIMDNSWNQRRASAFHDDVVVGGRAQLVITPIGKCRQKAVKYEAVPRSTLQAEAMMLPGSRPNECSTLHAVRQVDCLVQYRWQSAEP